MHERIERIKEHIKEHKVAYSCALTGIIVAGITVVIMRESHAGLIDRTQRELQDHRVHGFSRSLFLKSPISNSFNQTVVTVIEREGRGHPGYIVRCKETLEEFPSQAKAAIVEKVSDVIMSLHLNGKIENINGHHYERCSVDSVA